MSCCIVSFDFSFLFIILLLQGAQLLYSGCNLAFFFPPLSCS
jgi:hypothetical protein